MNKVKLYILPLFLLLSSLLAGIQTVKSLKDITGMESATAARSSVLVGTTPAVTRELGPEELLTAKNVFAALAASNDLKLGVTLAANKVSVVAEKNSGVLDNYEGIITYLTGISDLPYSMEYNSFCIGRGCSKDLLLEIALRK